VTRDAGHLALGKTSRLSQSVALMRHFEPIADSRLKIVRIVRQLFARLAGEWPAFRTPNHCGGRRTGWFEMTLLAYIHLPVTDQRCRIDNLLVIAPGTVTPLAIDSVR